MKPSILVTGGAGYIGSHCCKLLARSGYLPVVYDNLSTGHREFVKWGPLVEGDMRDEGYLKRVFSEIQPTAVMHLAALSLVPESVTHPERYRETNVDGSLALLEAMRAVDCDKLIFSSTCAVYGEPAEIPIDEETVKAPVNPYGASKLAAELMMDSYDRAHGIRSVRLRYFNACGADPEGEIGEDHDPETHLIPLILDVALGHRAHISIFGTDFPTPDGTPIRDYVHVSDIAAAHLAALDHLLGGGETLAVNLGTGTGSSVCEVISTVESVTGRPIGRIMAPRRVGDPPELVADPGRASKRLGWRAERSTLEVAVADAWRWHQSRCSVDA